MSIDLIESKDERRKRLSRERYIISSLDPEWVKRKNKKKREWRRRKKLEDPKWAENRLIKHREWYKRKEQDPDWLKKKNERRKELRLSRTPEQIEKIRKRRADYHAATRSKNQKVIFLERKQHIIDILGGKCVVCKYDKYIGGIDIHEVEKKLNMYPPSKCIRTTKGYNLMLDNLDILVPLCATCHREYHAGIIQLPEKSAPI